MHALGLRAFPEQLAYAVLCGTSAAPLLVEGSTVKAPGHYELPDQLDWYRDRVARIVDQHRITAAALRVSEPRAKPNRDMIPRFQLEGALLLALRVLGIHANTLILSQISSRLSLGKNASAAKEGLQNDEFLGLHWRELSTAEREAALVAATVLESTP